jgi:hypothetical protein
MNLRRLINLALAVFVTVGLAVAPLAGQGAAAQTRPPASTTMSTSPDMSCCPDQNSMDCQDCPLMAICVLQAVQAGPPMTVALPLRYAVETAHAVRNDAVAVGLARPPPDQPPRSQV